MKALDLLPAVRGTALLFAAFGLATASPAAASPPSCGDTLAAGSFLLEADLDCPSGNGSGVGLTLTSGANLDLGGHTVAMSIGGSGTAILVSGTGASVHDGTITSADTAVLVSGGGQNHLRNLHVTDANVGISLRNSDGNAITASEVSGAAVDGVVLESSNRNLLDQLTVEDTSGIGPAAGIALLASSGNVLTRSQVLGSQCTGVFVRDSSRNIICGNTVEDTQVFLGGPAVDILLRDASTQNLVCKNQVSATKNPAVTSDGINVGCKDGCDCNLGGAGFSVPSTGATGNLLVGNTADGELRYGLAQSPGNPGNVYAADQATGNGVANFAIDP
ncbi:MAG TPA: right-handed parallel beta-helix repeat-containing protein [Anaeromyxobacter sp.]|nr:right-handed parallel beta-helix repeat-containing protein [Anaeromyxobacter sp.]